MDSSSHSAEDSPCVYGIEWGFYKLHNLPAHEVTLRVLGKDIPISSKKEVKTIYIKKGFYEMQKPYTADNIIF